MKKLLTVLLLGLSIGAGLAIWDRRLGSAAPKPQVLTIQQLRALAELVTLKIRVQDVQETQLRGYVGSRRVIAAVEGEVLAGTDLSRARVENQREGFAVLVLAPPRVISARLDHERTRIVGNQARGLWLIVPGDAGRTVATDRAYAQAQKRLEQAAGDEKLSEQARRQAAAVLTEFCQRLGVRVEIRWGE